MTNKSKIYYGEHESQFGVLRMPENSYSCPVIVLIHGGFWQARYNLEENNPIADDLTQRGYATWNIEYRRVGEDRGGWTSTFNDVIDAINHLSKIAESNPIDLSKVIVIGHSAGGHLALWLGSRIKSVSIDGPFNKLLVSVQKVISLAGVTDLVKMWEIHEQKKKKSHVAALLDGSPEEVSERYKLTSPVELLPMKVEQVLIHGELDRHVPVDLSKDYYKYAVEKGENVKLVILPYIEHFKIIEPTSSAWTSVIDLL
ncbi:acetyl esterase/lipase [Cytobacillus oceanisediminis]|jgi:acetyl esterase/lipase|uniref:Acetyl esterase/lipase n=1 Tax=Cytobacillus oceanisediminis TaxID=665099 RepID=A0A2V3A6C3_9BACI|nr:alpha/beta hydrolase [Cytobacillus oceanisediminis]PWW32449.1 acetyl esterase/lipase [Cytobacillus oceanisediminis]